MTGWTVLWITVPAAIVMTLPVAAVAAPGVNARVEVGATLIASSVTAEEIERRASVQDRARQAEIAELRTAYQAAVEAGDARVAELEARLIAQQDQLVADLATDSGAYAREIAVFRGAIESIASTPEGAAALGRFNAGDRAGAISVLDDLRAARDAARRVRADLESASEAREIAVLALDARAKGDPAFDTAAVIARYEEVTELDPGGHWDWIELTRLYRIVGRSEEAAIAAQRAADTAANDYDRVAALAETAAIQLGRGDRAGARQRYEESLPIMERLSAAHPDSTELARGLSVTLTGLGDVRLSQGDRAEALGLYRRSQEIVEAMVAAEPDHPGHTSDLAVPMSKIADLFLSQGDRAEGLQIYGRVLEIQEGLLATDPTSVEYAQALSRSLESTGDALASAGDPSGALERFSRSLAITERLSAADPAALDRAYNLTVSLHRVANVMLGQGDREGALQRYERALAIGERLSAADPNWAAMETAVSVSLHKIGDILMDQGDLDGALERYRRSVQIGERLSQADPTSVDAAQHAQVPLDRIAEILSKQGDLDGALETYGRSLQIAERLYTSDPASAELGRAVSVSLDNVGDILVQQGDQAGARDRFQRSLDISARLAAADPGSAELARDLLVSNVKMSFVTRENRYLEAALAILLDQQAKNTLLPEDEQFIALIQGMLSQ